MQDHLLVGIHGNRGFQEVLSCFSRLPGVVVTGIGTGEPRGIDGGYGGNLPHRIADCQGFLEHSREED